MKKFLSLLILLAPMAGVQAQDTDAIRANAKRTIGQLCAPEFHGRGYVSNGDGLAAEWIAKQYAQIGLKPVKEDYFQRFHFNANSFPDSIKVALDGEQLTPGVDFLVGPSSGSADGHFALVHLTPDVVLDAGRRAMVMGVLNGRAACLDLPTTSNADTLRMYADLERELMHYCPVVRKARGKLTWGVSQEALPFPLIEVAGGRLTDSSQTIDLSVRNQLLLRHEAKNVVGMVKGSSSKYIIISAHYDHLGEMGPDALFPGANDNASGVAMLLSLAEYFAAHKPKHNILFVAFAGEEVGLVGSEWFAVDRWVDLADIRFMLNLDILGTGDDGITVVNATDQKAAYDKLVKINADKGYLAQVKSRGPACNSDHCPLVKRGVPGVFIYTLGGIAAYHDVDDKASTLPLTEFPDLYSLLKDFVAGLK
jgi:hypothetical protein